MSESSAGWYHCTRCGCLFKAAGNPDERGVCPECSGDPSGHAEAEAPEKIRVRKKVRKERSETRKVDHRSKRKARALMILVIVWVFVLGVAAILMKRMWPDDTAPSVVEDMTTPDDNAMQDQQLLRDQLPVVGGRLREYLAASDVGGQSVHVLRPDLALPRMVRFQQFNPILATRSEITAEAYQVLHTPAGRAIETLWKLDGGDLVEAVFFEDKGEWKLDWDALARAGTEPWPLFVTGTGEAEGEFRVLARERTGASGRSPDYIGLVLYTPRVGHPGEALSPSPEIRVPRNSEMGRVIEETFAARQEGIGAFGSKLVEYDPDEMIRLRVKVTREGEDERVFEIVELLGNHWLELPTLEE